MARLNPIVYIPPTVLILAIIGILVYRFRSIIQDSWYSLRYRLSGGRYEELVEDEALQYEDYGDMGLEEDEALEEEIYDQDQRVQRDEDQADIEPQGTTTSARLRMHHEMVQQMRARAGFAPEPFPGDEDEGGDGDGGEDDEEGEDDGGVGSSNGALAVGSAARIKKIGKKKAEKLQRKEQMRAYREFMDMQREERRQQEDLFKMQEALQQDERRRKRSAQIEKDRKRKEQLKDQQTKDNDSRLKRIQHERLNAERARRELRAYIQRVRSFRIDTLTARLGRTEAQFLRDLEAVSQDEDLQLSSHSALELLAIPRIMLASSLAAHPSLSSSLQAEPSRPQLLVLHDAASGQFVVLDKTKLTAFADIVKSKGRVNMKELSEASKLVFQPLPE